MKLFDKQFVYFDWEDSLKGKHCFTADSINDLKQAVNLCDDRMYGEVSESANCDYPFHVKGTHCDLVFAYYDPLYEFKRAYAEGKKIQFMCGGRWTDLLLFLRLLLKQH